MVVTKFFKPYRLALPIDCDISFFGRMTFECMVNNDELHNRTYEELSEIWHKEDIDNYFPELLQKKFLIKRANRYYINQAVLQTMILQKRTGTVFSRIDTVIDD